MSTTLRIEVFPQDLDSFFDFYTRILRFSVDRDERLSATPYVSVHRDAVRIGAVKSPVPVSPNHRLPPAGTEIVLEVDDLEVERGLIVSLGWPLETDLTVRPWGLRDFRVRDPDGYYLRFTTV
jgi:catechol 2,3-dioxygenase-like lactoylglutathione lyase family enzyme